MPKVGKTDTISVRLWLETVESIVGPNGLKSILNYAHLEKYIDNIPPDNDEMEIFVEDLRRFYLSLLELFGQKGALGLQLRVGRESIHIGLRKRPKIARALKLSAHLLPETQRMRLALDKMAEEYEKRQPDPSGVPRIQVQEEKDYFLFIDKANFESEGITSQKPICGAWIGRLGYLMEWITGHPHQVEEIECRAMGHAADVFKIVKAQKE